MKPNFKRHPDDEIIDDVRLRVVEREKKSDYSGDEWRFSYVTELRRKETLLYSRSYHTLADAVAHLPWLLRTWAELPDEEIPAWLERIDHDHETCHQPGCAKQATTFYRLKREYSEHGDLIDKSERSSCDSMPIRGFCKGHRKRGDCGREDSDRNYDEVPAP